jgi:hypothetical protein
MDGSFQRVGVRARERPATTGGHAPEHVVLDRILPNPAVLSRGPNATNDLTWQSMPRKEGLALGVSGGTTFHAPDFLRV